MKRLHRKIEEDITNIGENDIYPTQFIIDASSLTQIGHLIWVNENTSYIFYKSNKDDQLHVIIDGLIYESVKGFSVVDDNLLIDNIEQCKGKYGFYLNQVDDKAFDFGLVLEDGMESKKNYLDDDVVAVSNFYSCDGANSLMFGLKCMTFEEGHSVKEIFVATGDYKIENHINYDEELIDYISNKKIRK